jgi:hypothetical protein
MQWPPKLIEGYMPIQMLVEMGALALLFIGAFYLLDKKMGLKVNKLLQATLLFLFAWMYFSYRIYPPIPFSVRAIYATMTLIGIFMWISSTEEAWQDFRRPIIKVADSTSGGTWILKIAIVIILPFLVGWLGYNSMKPNVDEPIELRTVHPAPPASTKVHGKTVVLQTASSPFRVDDKGQYSDHIQNTHQEGNPWDEKAPPYLQYVREGGQIFFQNCHFCHGDNLNGRGMFAYAFNPIPANFTDPGTIAQLQETFVFWRVAKGGIGLPREGFPWASVMPPWEQHLTTDEIWKVILFEYWHTGYYPRTWD